MPADIAETPLGPAIRSTPGRMRWLLHATGISTLAALMCASPAMAQTTEAPVDDEPPHVIQHGPVTLNVATLSLAERKLVQAPPEPQPSSSRPTWRHTFGSERRAPVVSAARRPATFPADIVALTDVTSMTQARQMFPAGAYTLILSRQILTQATPDAPALASGVTAIAVRRTRELRITATEHLNNIAEPSPGTPLTAATAVRVMAGGTPVWVVAVSLAQSCAPATPSPCTIAKQQLGSLNAWIAARRASGEGVIVAGSFHQRLDADGLPETLAALARFPAKTAAPCPADPRSDHTHLLAAPGPQPRVPFAPKDEWRLIDEKDADAGCALIVRVSL